MLYKMKFWTGNIKWVHILRDSFTVCAYSVVLNQEGLSWWQLMSVLLEVRASCYTLSLILPHTCMEMHTYSLYPLQDISFLHKRAHKHTFRFETLDPSRCPSVGVICVTPPLTLSVTHLHSSRTPLCWHMAAGTLHGALKGIRLSSVEQFDLGSLAQTHACTDAWWVRWRY